MKENTLRKHALGIFRAALAAVKPEEAVRRHFRVEGNQLIAGAQRYALDRFRRVFVLGAGKAGASMARAVERTLGKRIAGGWVNVKYGHVVRLRRVQLCECGHPVPDSAGVAGAQKIAALAAGAQEDDLVVCLISGGASALLPAPAPPVTLEEKQAITRLLLACGANIHEINAVRKHISLIKGGQLARLCFPATVIALLLSDVIGDDLDVIGSGPVAPDASTFADALEILRRYGILEQTPASIRERLQEGAEGRVPETPKPDDPLFRRVQNLVVGSNRLAVDAAAREARRRGFRPVVLSTFVEGETREIARMHVAIARETLASGRPVRAPACFVSGGETTVTLRGKGLGGRNQEFALAAALDLRGLPGAVVLSAGTDGTDGPTDAAGAIADSSTAARALELGMDPRSYLDNNDSYPFFNRLGDLIHTGPTQTNVMDIHLVLISAPPRGKTPSR